MDKATKKLLEDHQAIIDAWFDEWLRREKDRIDGWWLKKKKHVTQQFTKRE